MKWHKFLSFVFNFFNTQSKSTSDEITMKQIEFQMEFPRVNFQKIIHEGISITNAVEEYDFNRELILNVNRSLKLWKFGVC